MCSSLSLHFCYLTIFMKIDQDLGGLIRDSIQHSALVIDMYNLEEKSLVLKRECNSFHLHFNLWALVAFSIRDPAHSNLAFLSGV